MSSESSRFVGVQQQTYQTVTPGSNNVDDDDGSQGPSVIPRVSRFTQIRRIIAVNPIRVVQQDESAGCRSMVRLVALTAVVGVPVAMMVIGALHVNDCPGQKYIPIYILLSGSTVLALLLLRLCRQHVNGCDGGDDGTACDYSMYFFAIFLFILNVSGAIMTYSVSTSVNTIDPDSPEYCHPLVYWSASGVIVAYLVLNGLYFGGVLSCKS